MTTTAAHKVHREGNGHSTQSTERAVTAAHTENREGNCRSTQSTKSTERFHQQRDRVATVGLPVWRWMACGAGWPVKREETRSVPSVPNHNDLGGCVPQHATGL